MKHLSMGLPVERISPVDGHYFFGYYDLQPYSADESLYLTHKTTFRNRLQGIGDVAEIGVVDTKSGKYRCLDKTFAWNFQQGAMLCWNPKAPNTEIIYNAVENDKYVGVVMDINTGKKRFLDMPVANVSRDGNYALSINFARLYNFRPGYGYCEIPDAFYYEKHSEKDGVFVIDMQTGKADLVLSMNEIWEFCGKQFFGSDQKMNINHITFNPSGTRFLALVRNFAPKGCRHDTAIITANRDGSDMYLLSDFGVQSHYYWLDDEHIIIYADGKETGKAIGWANNYILQDKTHEGILQDAFFVDDNHMSFNPSNTLMITDTYPNKTRNQILRLYSEEKKTVTDLGYFYSMENVCTDVRCDLHPRWNRKANAVTFDSTHEGFRGIYKISLTDDVLEKLFDENYCSKVEGPLFD